MAIIKASVVAVIARTVILRGSLATGADTEEELRVAAKKSLDRSVAFLIKEQGADGGWHSKTYGQLQGGPALTTLVLEALSHVPVEAREKHAAAIDKGFAFLRPGLLRRATIAGPDGSLDYPTYGAALWLGSVRRLERKEREQDRNLLLHYLLTAQVAEARGFDPQSPSFGGWDLLGQGDAQGITTGTNISVTRHVLESLALEQRLQPQDKHARDITAAIALGREWVLHCRQTDGGFCFTPEPMSLNNKADYKDEGKLQPRSYGTATCDGIRAMLACGIPADDKRVLAAAAWLAERPALELVPGFEGLPRELGWDRGLRFYYYASLTDVLPLLPQPEQNTRRTALLKMLVTLQKENGRYVNESDRMRENDPLIATSLALEGLTKLTKP